MFINYELLRSKRKSLTLTVDVKGRLIVKAPPRLPVSEIEKFIELKKKWIEGKLAKHKKINEGAEGVRNYGEVLFCGKAYRRVITDTKLVYLEDDKICLPKRAAADLPAFLARWYRKAAAELLTARAFVLAQTLNLTFNSLKITDTRKRWGACDAKGNLSFNFRIIALPPVVADYVVLHELAHLKHLNHSEKFWSYLAGALPNYKALKKSLNEYAYLLELFRKGDK